MLTITIIIAVLLLYYSAIYFIAYILRNQREMLYPRFGELDSRFAWEKKWHKFAYLCTLVASLLGTSLVSFIFFQKMDAWLWTWSIVCAVIITYFIFGMLKRAKP